MKITRREILKAIRTEKLNNGSFLTARRDSYNNFWVEDSLCKVCALGAVLRQKGISSHMINRAGGEVRSFGEASSDGDEFLMLRKRLYLNALSIKFEKLAIEHGVDKKTKTKLAGFVKRHFPKTINMKELNRYV